MMIFEKYLGHFVLLMYLIGLVLNFSDNTQEFAIQSTEWFLLFINTLILFYFFFKNKDIKIVLFSLLAFFITFISEVLGANFGLFFGEYEYGEIFRLKVFRVPVIIGINWVILIICSANLSSLIIKKNKVVHSLFSATVLVVLDFFIEPVAIYLNYWEWAGEKVPVQNYISWFMLGAIFTYLLNLIQNKIRDRNLMIFLLANFVFFILLSARFTGIL